MLAAPARAAHAHADPARLLLPAPGGGRRARTPYAASDVCSELARRDARASLTALTLRGASVARLGFRYRGRCVDARARVDGAYVVHADGARLGVASAGACADIPLAFADAEGRAIVDWRERVCAGWATASARPAPARAEEYMSRVCGARVVVTAVGPVAHFDEVLFVDELDALLGRCARARRRSRHVDDALAAGALAAEEHRGEEHVADEGAPAGGGRALPGLQRRAAVGRQRADGARARDGEHEEPRAEGEPPARLAARVLVGRREVAGGLFEHEVERRAGGERVGARGVRREPRGAGRAPAAELVRHVDVAHVAAALAPRAVARAVGGHPDGLRGHAVLDGRHPVDARPVLRGGVARVVALGHDVRRAVVHVRRRPAVVPNPRGALPARRRVDDGRAVEPAEAVLAPEDGAAHAHPRRLEQHVRAVERDGEADGRGDRGEDDVGEAGEHGGRAC